MFTDSLEVSSEPMNRASKLFMDAYQGIVDAQMTSLRGYIEIIEDQSKSALAIRNVDDVKEFVKKQPDILNDVVKRMSEDLQHFAKISEELRSETGQLFRKPEEASSENTNTAKISGPAKKVAASNS